MKNKVVRKLLMIGLSSSVALTSTVGVTAASMDTALEAVAEDETETETETEVDSEEDVTEETTEVVEETSEDTGVSTYSAPATKTIYVSYIDENGVPVDGAEIEQVTVPEEAVNFNASLLTKVPAGYELCVSGDIECTNDTINVAVRKKVAPAEKTIYVSYIDENGTPIDGAEIEQVKVPADAANFNASLLTKIPAGYELCATGDIECTNDTINVKVRKAQKTIYVSYVDESGMPLPNAIEKVKVPADAGNFSASLLNEIPEGYELVEKGDIPCASDTINVKVRKIVAVDTKIIYVSYIDENGVPVEGAEIEQVTVPADAANFNASLLKKVPAGYELCATGDIECVNDAINVTVRKTQAVVGKTVYVSYIDEETKQPLENAIEVVELETGATMFNAGILKKVPAGYELCATGDVYIGDSDTVNIAVRKAQKTVYVSYIDEETKMPLENAIEEIKLAADANSFNTSILTKVPAGYEVCITGDVTFEGDSVNVEVRKKAAEEKTVYVSYIDEETKMPLENAIEEIKLAADANSFNTSILTKVPAGYEVCVTGDVAFEGDSVNVEVRKKAAEEKTVYVSYIDEETKMPLENAIEEIKLAADANSFNTSILTKVPAGYEVCVTGDVAFEGDSVNVEVRKVVEEKTVYVSYIDADTKMPLENAIEELKVAADATMFNTSALKAVPVGYTLAVTGDVYFGEGDSVNVEVRKKAAEEKSVYVSYIDEETKMPFENGIEEIKVAADATSFNTSVLTAVPEGYELCITGDIAFEGDSVNVEVRKKAAEEKTVYVSYIDEETKMPFENGIEEIKVAADATSFNTSILTAVPAGYELCITGDIAFEGDSVNVEVRKAEKSVYVSYIDEETKMPFENGIEEIKVAADATSFNTSILTKVPAGYELCITGDIAFEGDSVNVEVRKAEKSVYVSYIDEETKMPLENAIEEIKLAADATSFNTSVLAAVPAGYELCAVGDVYIGENDTVNVEVRKVVTERTVYVSYIDEETKMPFENGIEEIKVAADATTFNTSVLTAVPAGYELCETGDVYIGENDTVNVEVRKSVVREKDIVIGYVDEKDGTEIAVSQITIPEDATYFNTSMLTDVPEGYELVTVGDIWLGSATVAEVQVRKIENVQDVTVQYVTEDGEVVGTGALQLDADATYVNTNALTDVPEGYVVAIVGDLPIEDGTVVVTVRLAETDPENPTPTPDPENPENPDPETPDPENPTPEPENPDQPTNPQPTTRPENNNNNNNNTNTNQNQAQTQTNNPRTGDMTNTMPLFAGLLGSGAMIGLIQRLRRRKDDK
ncbi:hypothetical protein [Blautia sp.]|uniref:hypothetical protein n=1 Tax=Blautia sp. TaxID=1955243 RepID=UPI003D931333